MLALPGWIGTNSSFCLVKVLYTLMLIITIPLQKFSERREGLGCEQRRYEAAETLSSVINQRVTPAFAKLDLMRFAVRSTPSNGTIAASSGPC